MLLILCPPFTWLLVADYPWSDYRWLWIAQWPALPGLPVLPIVRLMGIESTGAETAAMGVMTAAMAIVSVLLARRSRCWLIGTVCVLCA